VTPEPTRPCRYCIANWTGMSNRIPGRTTPPILPTGQDCEWNHERNDQPLYDLATVLARVFTGDRQPCDEQIGWYLLDAEDVLGDYDALPLPGRWRVRKLPESANDGERGIDIRLRVNEVTYVGLEGGKDSRGSLVKLSTFREWHREGNHG